MDYQTLKQHKITYQGQFKGFVTWNNSSLYRWEYELLKDLRYIGPTGILNPKYSEFIKELKSIK